MTGRAYRDASEPEGSMTNPSEAMPWLVRAIDSIRTRLHEHAGGKPECRACRVSEYLDAAFGEAIGEPVERLPSWMPQQAATPVAPVQNDDAERLRELATEADELGRQYVALSPRHVRRIANRLTPDRVTPLVEASRKLLAAWQAFKDSDSGNQADAYYCLVKSQYENWDALATALRDGGFDDA